MVARGDDTDKYHVRNVHGCELRVVTRLSRKQGHEKHKCAGA